MKAAEKEASQRARAQQAKRASEGIKKLAELEKQRLIDDNSEHEYLQRRGSRKLSADGADEVCSPSSHSGAHYIVLTCQDRAQRAAEQDHRVHTPHSHDQSARPHSHSHGTQGKLYASKVRIVSDLCCIRCRSIVIGPIPDGIRSLIPMSSSTRLLCSFAGRGVC